MVGPGTGVAPFRAFVQERRALTKATGKSWLFFGVTANTPTISINSTGRKRWPTGALDAHGRRRSRALRRKKVCVQHKIWERRRELIEWLDGGASFYVCGDAKNYGQ